MFLKFLIVGVLLQFHYHVSGEDMIGPGKWDIKRIDYLQGPFDEIIIDLKQSKVDRTSYAYDGKITLKRDLDESLGVKIDVEKNCDGGFKPFQVTSDSSLIKFADKFVKSNIDAAFLNMGLEDTKWPLPANEYTVKSYPFGTDELPPEFAYGHFLATLCCLDGNKPIGCMEIEYEFKKKDGDDDDDDE